MGIELRNFAYITDASFISPEELAKLEGLDVLIINALRRRPHPTHFSLEQAVNIAQILKPKKTFFTHITHDLNHNEINRTLPKNIRLGFDGLELTI